MRFLHISLPADGCKTTQVNEIEVNLVLSAYVKSSVL